jgi:hypothetical protein
MKQTVLFYLIVIINYFQTQVKVHGNSVEKVLIPSGNSTNPPLKNFGLFIEKEPSLIAFKARVSHVMYAIKLDFTRSKFLALQTQIQKSFQNFEMIPALNKSELLANNYMSLMEVGYFQLVEAEKAIHYILTYTNEHNEEPYGQCNITLEEIKADELTRIHLNMENRLSQIKTAWTSDEVSKDLSKQSAIMAVISVFNDGVSEVYAKVMKMTMALDAMSEHEFPASILGANKSCSVENSREGENYEIQACYAHKNGYSCAVEITQPIALRNITRLYPVVYDNLFISGSNPSHWIVKESDPPSIQEVECEFLNLQHPVCSTEYLSPECKQAISASDTDLTIASCNISKIEKGSMYKVIVDGILVLDATKIVIDGNEIHKGVPLLIYSPTPVTISKNDETYVVSSNAKHSNLNVISSSLTIQQRKYLHNRFYWSTMYNGVGSGEVIDFVLILFEIFSFPILIFGLLKGHSTVQKSQRKTHKKHIYKLNRVALLKGKEDA